MKLILVLAVIVLIARSVYHARKRHPRTVAPTPVMPSRSSEMSDPSVGRPRFHCDGRRYCSQMKSRAEAVYFMRHCPGTRMDGDHDGISCEHDSRF